MKALSRIYHLAHFHVDVASIGNVASAQTTKMINANAEVSRMALAA